MRSIHLRRCALALLFCVAAACAAPAFAVSSALLGDALKTKAAKTAKAVAPANDTALATRLTRKLRDVPGLDDVNVTVVGGVARLDGAVLDGANATRAAQLVSAEPGVAKVENRIDVDAGVRARLDGAADIAMGKLMWLVGMLPLLVIAILIVLLTNWVGRTLARRIHLKRLNHRDNPYFDALVRRVTHAVIVIVGVLLALELVGWTGMVGAVIGSAGVLGLIVGFAFKDIAENYVAGILLSVRRPFKPGDHIVIEKFEGKVVALTSRSTVLMTLDGNRLSLPNALVFKSVLLNYSENPKRRFEFDVTIDPEQSIGTAQALALQTMAGVGGVLDDPAPSSLVHAYAPSGSVLRFFGWVDQTGNDLGKVRTEALRAVKGAFADAAIELPRSVHYIIQQTAQEQKQDVAAMPQQEQAGRDTSVNHDIDHQMAQARTTHSSDNLL